MLPEKHQVRQQQEVLVRLWQPGVRMVGLCVVAACVILVSALSMVSLAVAADDGLHKQSWFHESFLDLRDDLAEAQAEGKGLLVAIEQAGCPYCREMHRVNFADTELVAYLRKHFVFVQLDLRGSREVTDFDGKTMEERKLARRWGIVFTPTLLLFNPVQSTTTNQTGKDLASATMPGYFKPFHFRTMLEFVAAGHFRNKHFQTFVGERANKLRSQGKKVKVW